MARRLLVGLGNPGREYESTRHNAGELALRFLVDTWRTRCGVEPTPPPFPHPVRGWCVRASLAFPWRPSDAQHGSAAISAHDLVDMASARRRERTAREGVPYPRAEVHALVPDTYMNRSGLAVRQVHDLLKLRLKRNPTALNAGDELLVIHDDSAIPFGALRLKPKGGDGGHNGVANIIRRLGHGNFARLKIGVGPAPGAPPPRDLADFVLAPFRPEEQAQLPAVLAFAAEVVRVHLHRGCQAAAQVANSMTAAECARALEGERIRGADGAQGGGET